MVGLDVSYRRIASNGDYGFNRNNANDCKQYAKPVVAAASVSVADDIKKINDLSSYFNENILKKWNNNSEYHIMNDSDWQKAINLSKLVYDVSLMSERTPSVIVDAGSVLAANICSLAASIEEKCAIFLGEPENVSLAKKMLTVYTMTPESASLLYKSTLFNNTMLSRRKEEKSSGRVEFNTSRPFRPSLFERFGSTVHEDEISASNGAFSTLSASNTHAKALIHFTRVACAHMQNSLDVVDSSDSREERASVARSLLKESVLGDDAAILYGNAADCMAFAHLVEKEPINRGIIPEEFTRDMERTPYIEMDHGGSNIVTVYSDRFSRDENGKLVKNQIPISLKINIGQLLCDMIFGSDWDIHLKDYLSLLGYETVFDHEQTSLLLLDKSRTNQQGNLVLVMVSRYIKTVSQTELDRLLANENVPFTPTSTIADYIRLVVRHIYFDLIFNNGLQDICTKLSENYETPIETVDGELEEVTGNLFLSRIVDSLHIMRNQDLSRVCYNISVSLSDNCKNNGNPIIIEENTAKSQVFDGKVTISWDATSRRVIAVSQCVNTLFSEYDNRNTSILNKIRECLKRDTPPNRFFNYKAMYDTVKYMLREYDSPISHRFSDSRGEGLFLKATPKKNKLFGDIITTHKKAKPTSQTSKLINIKRKIRITELSEQQISNKINDTELSKATDSVLNRSLGGGFKIFAGRFTIMGSVIGILGEVTVDLLQLREDLRTVPQAVSEVLGTTASEIVEGGATIKNKTLINSPVFIFGVPLATVLAFTFVTYKRFLGFTSAVFFLLLFTSIFAGFFFSTSNWLATDNKLGTFISYYTHADKKRINKLLYSVEAQQGHKTVDIKRPLFGPARPTQDMTLFHIGLLY